MKMSRSLVVLFPFTAALALAQSPDETPTTAAALRAEPEGAAAATPAIAAEAQPSRGETAVMLDVGFGIRAVLPSRITVPTGESLRIIAPEMGPGVQYIWTRNGRAIADASERSLLINYVTSSDAGTYACLFSTPTTLPQSSQSLVLGVGPTDRLVNISTRATIGGSGDESLVSGFVVATGSQAKKIVVRAVGPSLSMFGVANPLRAPVLKIFDRSGKLYENDYVYPAVVGGPNKETDLAESLARTGAFPLPSGTQDKVDMRPFSAGNYTVQVTSADGTAGTVLLEIYEVP